MAVIWVDSNRKIIEVDAAWDNLARINGAPQLSGHEINGKSMWQFIQGDAPKMFVDAVITRVNVSEKPYIIHYRCDSKDLAQLMRMMVTKEGDDRFKVEHDLIHSQKITPEINFEENMDAAELRCAICGKVKFKGGWYDALTNRKIFGTLTKLKTRSSICPSCDYNIPSNMNTGEE